MPVARQPGPPRVTIPNRAAYNPRTGEWEIENHGVTPDVHQVIDLMDGRAGRDPQLERAIAVALGAMEQEPATSRTPRPMSHPARDP